MTNEAHAGLSASLSWTHERVVIVHDPASGLQGVIAIHSTVLGPALGGLRIRAYDGGPAEALDDALRLSHAMTLKASAAGLDLGGGKAVVVDDGRAGRREARLDAFAREVEALGGAYVTAEDIGTTTADMDRIALHTEHVVGRSPRGTLGGDPSPSTARTVLGAMRAALQVLGEPDDLEGRTVGVVGLGKVGGRLARRLAEAGARVIGCDPVPEARAQMAGLGVEAVARPDAVLARELDVLAPCATGGLIDAALAGALRCRVVCGAANNPLRGPRAAERLHARGVLYVPDFLANCGGLIHVDAERRRDGDPASLAAALDAARERVHAVLEHAVRERREPARLAAELAWRRIAVASRAAAPTGVR